MYVCIIHELGYKLTEDKFSCFIKSLSFIINNSVRMYIHELGYKLTMTHYSSTRQSIIMSIIVVKPIMESIQGFNGLCDILSVPINRFDLLFAFRLKA